MKNDEFQADIDTTKRPATKAYETFSSLDRSNLHSEEELFNMRKDWR